MPTFGRTDPSDPSRPSFAFRGVDRPTQCGRCAPTSRPRPWVNPTACSPNGPTISYAPASVVASTSSPASHADSGTDTGFVATNPCPHPWGSEPQAAHWDTKSRSTDDVTPLPKVNSTWQVPAPLASSVMYREFSAAAQSLPAGIEPFAFAWGQTEQGPVVFTTGGSVGTHPKSMTAELTGPGQLQTT